MAHDELHDELHDEPRDASHDEPHDQDLTSRLNWLRAGVLGANDGIVSTAGVIVGVAGADAERSALLIAGVAALAAGALSMAAGEYVSVSTQRDTEQAMLHEERRELREDPAGELEELTGLYVSKGISPDLAAKVAEQLTANDALAAHAEVELGIDPDTLTNPWQAALASMLSFVTGALLPLLTVILSPAGAGTATRVGAVVVAVVVALALTGAISARLGHSPGSRAILRNVGGGLIAMAATYGIGALFGTAIG